MVPAEGCGSAVLCSVSVGVEVWGRNNELTSRHTQHAWELRGEEAVLNCVILGS